MLLPHLWPQFFSKEEICNKLYNHIKINYSKFNGLHLGSTWDRRIDILQPVAQSGKAAWRTVQRAEQATSCTHQPAKPAAVSYHSNLTFVAFVTDYVTSTVTFAVFVTGLITLFDPLFITYASYEIYFKHQLYFRWKVDLHWQFGKLKNFGMHLSHLTPSIRLPLQKHSPWALQVLFIDPASSQLHSWQLPSDLLKYPLSHSSHLVPV